MVLHRANELRRKKAMDNRWELYEFLHKHSGFTVYELSKKMKWTTGKVDYYIKKLVKEGLLVNSTEIVNGRVHKTYTPKSWKDLSVIKIPEKE